MQISELQDGMKQVTVEATVGQKGDPREVRSKFKTDQVYRICDAIIFDDSGSIKLTLWNDDIERMDTGDRVRIENGYITSFKGEIQLNAGKYGKMTVTKQ